MAVFYRPKNAFVGDVIPFFDGGLFKPFYLKIWRDYDGPDRTDGWHMLTTADHLLFGLAVMVKFAIKHVVDRADFQDAARATHNPGRELLILQMVGSRQHMPTIYAV